VSLGEYKGGVHHIATDKEFTGDLNGHLLLSEGVVSGDFNLQIHAAQLKEHHFVDDHDNLPQIGTSKYEELNQNIVYDNCMTLKSTDETNIASIPKPAKFYVHGQHISSVPATAAKYITSAQGSDVNAKAEKLGPSEVGIINARVNYLIKLFQGFYPDITFYHDIGRLESNAYAFENYGKQIVVLPGGLTRIKNLGVEGLAIILGHLVVRLQQRPPLDNDGYTSVGMADYYSSGVLDVVFFPVLNPDIFGSGLSQIEQAIFSNINPEHDKYEGDPYQPSIETRIDSMTAGNSTHYPPRGIGGPVLGGLQLTGATASPPQLQPSSFITYDIDTQIAQEVYRQLQEHQILDSQGILNASFNLNSDLSFLFAGQPDNLRTLLIEQVRYVLLHAGASIQVSFNMAVNPQTATDEEDYELEPAAKVFTAQVSQDDPSVVVLSAQIERNVEYTLTVGQYVKAANGSTLDLETNTTQFRLV